LVLPSFAGWGPRLAGRPDRGDWGPPRRSQRRDCHARRGRHVADRGGGLRKDYRGGGKDPHASSDRGVSLPPRPRRAAAALSPHRHDARRAATGAPTSTLVRSLPGCSAHGCGARAVRETPGARGVS